MPFGGIHLWAGMAIFLAFLGTSVTMHLSFPQAYAGNGNIRVFNGANPIYLLAAGLLSVALGATLVRQRAGRRPGTFPRD